MKNRKNIYLTLLISLISLTIFYSCAKSGSNLELAIFDNGSVMYQDYLDHYLLSTQYKPDEMPTRENLLQIVELKGIEKIAVQEALEEGIDKDSSYLSIVRNNERRLLYQKYVNSKFVENIITDSLIQKFYSEYTPQYHMKFIMRPIVKSSTSEFIEQQKDTIWIAYKKLIDDEDFEKVAKNYSQDITTKDKGGEIGWIIVESMGDHIVRSVMDTMRANSYSIPFRGYGGYYILYKGEHRDIDVPPFNNIKERIWKSLYRSRKPYIKDELEKQFSELSKKYNYQLNRNNIDSALKIAKYKTSMSKYTELNFDDLTEKDMSMKIAEYNDGYILLMDLFANSKKAPINKFEFDNRLENIAEEHIIAKYAKEIGLQNEEELPEQIQSMKTSLLRAILFDKNVNVKVTKELEELGSTKNAAKRNELKTKYKTDYENYLKTKYNFKFLSDNFEYALSLAEEKKKEQNLEKQKDNPETNK